MKLCVLDIRLCALILGFITTLNTSLFNYYYVSVIHVYKYFSWPTYIIINIQPPILSRLEQALLRVYCIAGNFWRFGEFGKARQIKNSSIHACLWH